MCNTASWKDFLIFLWTFLLNNCLLGHYYTHITAFLTNDHQWMTVNWEVKNVQIRPCLLWMTQSWLLFVALHLLSFVGSSDNLTAFSLDYLNKFMSSADFVVALLVTFREWLILVWKIECPTFNLLMYCSLLCIFFQISVCTMPVFYQMLNLCESFFWWFTKSFLKYLLAELVFCYHLDIDKDFRIVRHS